MTALALDHLGFAIGSATILDDVSLAVPAGERLAIVGASGSGKSTLLRLIAGFERPTTGRILLAGTVAAEPARMTAAHRRRIAYVPQDGALFPQASARGNIRFGARGLSEDRIRAIADVVGLEEDLLERMPHELSGGQQQRVALARALAVGFPMVVLDEPFSALDAGLRAATRDRVIAAFAAAGTTAILVTHDQEEALTFGGLLGVLEGGRLRQLDAPAALFEHPVDAELAGFLGPIVLLPGVADGLVAQTPIGEVALRARGDATAGSVRVMLRPEQLVPIADAAGALTVVAADAVGAAIRLRLAVGDTAVDLVRDAHDAPPEVGTRVRVEVRGTGLAYPA